MTEEIPQVKSKSKTYRVTYGNFSQLTEAVWAQQAAEKVLKENSIEPIGIPDVKGLHDKFVFVYQNVMVSVEIIPAAFPYDLELRG
jgi:hypothetical protein